MLLAYGDERVDGLRSALGTVAPELLSDVAQWMARGTIPGLAEALAGLQAPLLVVTATRDNLVHPEHALALKARHDTIVLSRIEGFAEDAGHLALQAPWAEKELFPEIAAWLDSH